MTGTAPAPTDFSTTAPEGSHFEFEEVKTGRGTESLGDVPMLIWDDLDAAVAHYGVPGILDLLDGTSLRVSFQNIARRYKTANKSLDEIAAAQITFRPGKRNSSSTPKSRANKAVTAAVATVGGDALAELLAKIANGTIDVSQFGIIAKPEPVAEEASAEQGEDAEATV